MVPLGKGAKEALDALKKILGRKKGEEEKGTQMSTEKWGSHKGEEKSGGGRQILKNWGGKKTRLALTKKATFAGKGGEAG